MLLKISEHFIKWNCTYVFMFENEKVIVYIINVWVTKQLLTMLLDVKCKIIPIDTFTQKEKYWLI